MTLKTKPFNQMFSFSRAGGATRVNAAGLIVGVDFSSTSNTIGTGSKTFTLAADANVDRDWAIGSNVIAVSQAGATGSMTGTVTSYTASTQSLVINVASITGSGTSTNWRIGSLEARRDFDPVTLAPKGLLVEGQVTEGHLPNSYLSPATAGDHNITPVLNESVGYAFDVEATTSVDSYIRLVINEYPLGFAATGYAWRTLYAKKVNCRYVSIRTPANAIGVTLDLDTGLIVTSGIGSGYFFTQPIQSKAVPIGNGWYKFGWALQLVGNAVLNQYRIGFGNTLSETDLNTGIVSNIGDTVRLAYPSMYYGGSFDSSPIPTTTVAVTRAADIPNIDGSRFSSIYNQQQGTLLIEMTPVASSVQAVAASVNDGTLNNAIRIGQKQSGTLSSIRAIASDGVTDVMAVNASVGTLRSNGIDYAEISHPNQIAKFGAASSGVGNFLVCGPVDQVTTTSDAGLSYTERSFQNALAGAHFGIGRFVIAASAISGNPSVSSGTVIVSTDGLSFRRINIPGLTANLTEITSNGTNQYVAVGGSGVIYTSPDSETWTAQTSLTANTHNGVTYGGGRYVVASTFNFSPATLQYSSDGASWSLATGISGKFRSYRDVAYDGVSRFVAVGNNDGSDAFSGISTSADGITWTDVFAGSVPNSVLNGVHFADGLWVAVGESGTVVTSPDGITWTDRTATSGSTGNITEVNFFNGKFYYVSGVPQVGENTAAGIVAGTTWAIRDPGIGSALSGIATNGTRLLICGNAGGIATSDDGTTFTSRTGNTSQLNGAAFGAGTYVVVGDAVNGSGLIATVDPTTFAYTRRVSGVATNLQGVRFVNGAFFASANSSTNNILSSSDGVSWTSYTVASNAASAGARNIDFGAGVYVVAMSGGTVASSSNGTTFTAQVIDGTLPEYKDVAFGNGVFVVVGVSGKISTSPNGTTWTARTSGVTSALNAVHWSTRDQCFYAVGDEGVIIRSNDGITWENISNDAIGSVVSSGAIQSNPALTNLIPGQVNKVAMRYAANDFAVSVNGSDPFKDASGTVPTANRISLGMSGVQTFPFNGHIRKFNYYPGVMTDSELKEITGL